MPIWYILLCGVNGYSVGVFYNVQQLQINLDLNKIKADAVLDDSKT